MAVNAIFIASRLRDSRRLGGWSFSIESYRRNVIHFTARVLDELPNRITAQEIEAPRCRAKFIGFSGSASDTHFEDIN